MNIRDFFNATLSLPAFSSFQLDLRNLIANNRDTILDIGQNALSSLKQTSSSERIFMVTLLGVAGLTSFAGMKLYKSLTRRNKITHIISNPEALDHFKGHSNDPEDKYNLFASYTGKTESPFNCPTRKQSKKLRTFLFRHLSRQLSKNREFITREVISWGNAFNLLPDYDKLIKSSLQIDDSRIKMKLTDSGTELDCTRDAPGRFFLSVMWHLFIGSGEAPTCFTNGHTFGMKPHSYQLSDLDILTERLKDNGMEEELALEMIGTMEDGMNGAASLFCTSLFLLKSHPDVEKQLFHELKTIIDGGETLYEAAKKSTLLKKMIGESMRLGAGSNQIRRSNARKEFVIQNPNPEQSEVVVKRGDSVIFNFNDMAKNPRIVGSNPDQFDFNRPCYKEFKNIQMAPWKQFGNGFHKCPGADMVDQFCSLVLASIIFHFKVSRDPKRGIIFITPREDQRLYGKSD